MKKQIQDYLFKIQGLLKECPEGTDWSEVAKDHLIKIGFYQHERLIHLIVTVLFALMEIISISMFFVTETIFLLILACLLLVLLVPYVFHYYFLENSVQQMYLIYDEISTKILQNPITDL